MSSYAGARARPCSSGASARDDSISDEKSTPSFATAFCRSNLSHDFPAGSWELSDGDRMYIA